MPQLVCLHVVSYSVQLASQDAAKNSRNRHAANQEAHALNAQGCHAASPAGAVLRDTLQTVANQEARAEGAKDVVNRVECVQDVATAVAS